MASRRLNFEWLRKYRPALNLSWYFLWITLSVVVVGLYERNPLSGLNMIWIANGLILSFLLLVPRNRWLIYLVAGFAALYLGGYIVHERGWLNFFYNFLDCMELYIIAFLLRPKNSVLPEFTSVKYVLKFIAFATLLGPLISATIFALTLHILFKGNFTQELLGWLGSDGLGIGVTTPTCIAIFHKSFGTTTDWKKRGFYMLLLMTVTVFVFSQNKPPMLLLIYPLLLLLLVNTEISWSAMGMLLVALVGGWFTLNGHGPLTIESMTMQQRSIWLQIVVAAGMVMLYTVSLVIENLRRVEHNLKKTAALHNLVVENMRDVIILSTLTGIRTYVSAGAYAATGWEPKDLINKSFVELAHPQDRAELEMVIKALQAGSEGGILEYRARQRNGEYIWVEASLHAYHEPGTSTPVGILNLVRDITDRKRAEHQLQESYRAVEALAIVDALTGTANRRRFDEFLNMEWRRRMRTGKPLSLVMIDADSFKLYNDTYGHVRGDSCLKQIAEAAHDVVGRPGDLVARYGGEEFAVILPDTDLTGAKVVAEEICKAVSNRRLRHEKSAAGIVTVSLGYATMIPQRGMNAQSLIEAADKALYQAKHSGKNCAVGAHQLIPVCGENPSTSAVSLISDDDTKIKIEAA